MIGACACFCNVNACQFMHHKGGAKLLLVPTQGADNPCIDIELTDHCS